MNWAKKPREPLIISVSDNLTASDISRTEWAKLRKIAIQKANNICRYCGGQYNKFVTCIHMDGNKNNNKLDNLDICCRACYNITHINYDYESTLSLCWSSKSQVDIVRRTVDHFIKRGKKPTIQDIDSQAKAIPLSLVEFSNILFSHRYDTLPKEFANYKIFFNQNFDARFITSKIYNTKSLFVDSDDSDSDSDEDDNIDRNNELQVHAMSKNERDFINEHFAPCNKNVELSEAIVKHKYSLGESQYKNDCSRVKHAMLCMRS